MTATYFYFKTNPLHTREALSAWNSLDVFEKIRVFQTALQENNQKFFNFFLRNIKKSNHQEDKNELIEKALGLAANRGHVDWLNRLIECKKAHCTAQSFIGSALDAVPSGQLQCLKILGEKCTDEEMGEVFSRFIFSSMSPKTDMFDYLYGRADSETVNNVLTRAERFYSHRVAFPGIQMIMERATADRERKNLYDGLGLSIEANDTKKIRKNKI